MKKVFLISIFLAIPMGAAYAAPKGAQTVLPTGAIDIATIRKQTNIDHVTDESVGVFSEENAKILNKVKVADGVALPEDLKEKTENLDKVELAKPKVPDFINDQALEKQRGVIDLEKITKQYNEALLKDDKKQQKNSLSDFEVGRAYLFISATIPKKTLEKLLNDAGKYNVAVFLKGNIGPDPLKFAGTQAFMQQLKIETPPELFIHPDAFQMFKIDRVPALVVAASDAKDNLDEQGCAALNDYDIVYGDLNIAYNLSQIYENASSPDIKDVARQYMKHIKVSETAKN